jgi:hypothetical protein
MKGERTMTEAATTTTKKKAKATVDTAALDKLREIQNKNLDSIPVKVKSGELDPEAVKISDLDLLRPIKAETLRIAAILEPLLDEHYSRGGRYKWNISFWKPGDPATLGVGGYQLLQVHMLSKIWTPELQAAAGLHEYEGAVCWAGRGRFDRHVICAKTTDLRARQFDAKEKRLQQQFESVEAPEVPGARVGKVEINETVTKVPIHTGPVSESLSGDDED